MRQKSLVILCDGSVRYFCLTFFSATTLKDGNGSNVIYFFYEGSHFLTHCIIPLKDLIINKVSYTLL